MTGWDKKSTPNIQLGIRHNIWLTFDIYTNRLYSKSNSFHPSTQGKTMCLTQRELDTKIANIRGRNLYVITQPAQEGKPRSFITKTSFEDFESRPRTGSIVERYHRKNEEVHTILQIRVHADYCTITSSHEMTNGKWKKCEIQHNNTEHLIRMLGFIFSKMV